MIIEVSGLRELANQMGRIADSLDRIVAAHVPQPESSRPHWTEDRYYPTFPFKPGE